MTDPLSIIASTFTLTSAITYGASKVRSLYTAPAQIDRIKAEVESLESLLEAVREFAQANAVRSSVGGSCHNATNDLLVPSLDLARGRIDSVHKILTSPAFGLKSLRDSNKARTTYLRHNRRLAGLEQELKDAIQKININLVLANA